MSGLRLLLLPFSLLYGLVLTIRHLLYDLGIWKSHSFSKPVVVIGNLLVGGAGKSPMTEYLIRRWASRGKIAILSRGYGRHTKGFLEVRVENQAAQVGDEPLQFKRKFPELTVGVCESRVEGLKRLMPEHDLFLLDDAFQHRSLRASLQLLLFDYPRLRKPAFLLPAGDYRDLFSRRNRADAVVVTKVPEHLTISEQEKIRQRLRLKQNIPIFFSYIQYGSLIRVSDGVQLAFPASASWMALTGIAQSAPFINYLKTKGRLVQCLSFRDHHAFSRADLEYVAEEWRKHADCEGIITTEKDLMRLKSPDLESILRELPLFYIPIEARFMPGEGQAASFEEWIDEQVWASSN